MTIKKNYFKTKPICKVTFKIPAEVGFAAKSAKVVGEFNNWSFTANPMKRLKKRGFLNDYRFGKGKGISAPLFTGQDKWENEVEADKFVPSPYGDSENSVIIL